MSHIRRVLRSTVRAFFGVLTDAHRGSLMSILSGLTSPSQRMKLGFPAVEGVLALTKQNGFSPETIVDIGAYAGDWARMARRVFPDAALFMVDGNPEREQPLSQAAVELRGKVKFFITLLGPEPREGVTLHQLETGTSVLPQLTTFPFKEVKVPMQTLDLLFSEETIADPVLLKLDVQGFELEVLKGGRGLLSRSEVVVLEVSTLPYNEGAPLLAEVIAFMQEQGFVVFDLGEQYRRQTDQVLFQFDMVFTRQDSRLREKKKYWLNEP